MSNKTNKPSKLLMQLAVTIAVFIFAIEGLLLVLSYQSRSAELHDLRDKLDADVMLSVGKQFNDLHPEILSDADIARRLQDYAINVTVLTLLISMVVILGTLTVFEIIAGKHIRRLVEVTRASTPGNMVRYSASLPDNEIGELIASREDLSERLRGFQDDLAGQLEEAKAHLVQNAKMSIVGELTATIVHDLSNHLSLLLGYTELLLDDPDMNHAQRTSCLEMILAGTLRIKNMADRMTSFARMSSAMEEGQDLRRVVEDSLAIIDNKLISTGVKPAVLMPDEQVQFWGDSSMIEQVLINLVNNACDAMADHDQQHLSLTITHNANRVRVQVTDSGPGVPDSIREDIFKTFYTTKPKGAGTGLGLASCQQILGLHHSELRLESAAGPGATFTFDLLRFSRL